MIKNEIKIMIVDDEVETTTGLKAYLRHDFEVITFNDVRDAKNYLENNTVQIIISDQKMPHYYGVAFLKECRTIAPNAIRILFSAHVGENNLVEAIEDGTIFRFIHKPISIDWGKFDSAIEDAVRIIKERMSSTNF